MSDHFGREFLPELAHHRAQDHYSADFYNECCRLGAKLQTFERKEIRV